LSALNTTSNLKIYNNIISWAKEGTADTSAYVYNVKFFDDQDNSHEVSLKADTTNSIDLTNESYESILNALTGTKFISIQKYVGGYVANAEKTNYLSSVYSKDVVLKIIQAPTNVTIELAEDLTGNNAITQNAKELLTNVQTAVDLSVNGGVQTTSLEVVADALSKGIETFKNGTKAKREKIAKDEQSRKNIKNKLNTFNEELLNFVDNNFIEEKALEGPVGQKRIGGK
jgi:hypothetical protein